MVADLVHAAGPVGDFYGDYPDGAGILEKVATLQNKLKIFV